jgi:hypothetical protein
MLLLYYSYQFVFCKITTFFRHSNDFFFLNCHYPPEGWWVGKAEKWRSPFLGEELAVRCERNEHGKSQLSISLICQIALRFQPYFLSLSARTVARVAANVVAA